MANFGLHDWDTKLEKALKAYDASFASSIGYNPDEMWRINTYTEIDNFYEIYKNLSVNKNEKTLNARKNQQWYHKIYKVVKNDSKESTVWDLVWYHDPILKV